VGDEKRSAGPALSRRPDLQAFFITLLMAPRPDPKELIARLGLAPLPVEGGLFRQTYVADETLPAAALPARYGRAKPLSTAIYYLLTSEPDSFSALHRLPTEEVYHFYLGDPVEMLLLHPDRRSEEVRLGPDLLGGERVQLVVPRGVWQGSRLRPRGSFALLGTTMAPGFDPADYEGGERDALVRLYPGAADRIRALTRAGTRA
jgi:predicted cupin superfamily sugar epimerase